MNRYYRHLIDEAGWDATGRNMERRIPPEGPRRTVWQKIYKGEQVMTTNDIAMVAEVFGVTPYQWVEDARRWGDEQDGGNVTPIRPNVGPTAEDVEYSEYPDTMPAAAEEVRKPGKD